MCGGGGANTLLSPSNKFQAGALLPPLPSTSAVHEYPVARGGRANWATDDRATTFPVRDSVRFTNRCCCRPYIGDRRETQTAADSPRVTAD